MIAADAANRQIACHTAFCLLPPFPMIATPAPALFCLTAFLLCTFALFEKNLQYEPQTQSIQSSCIPLKSNPTPSDTTQLVCERLRVDSGSVDMCGRNVASGIEAAEGHIIAGLGSFSYDWSE
jgi:hypothetical protein